MDWIKKRIKDTVIEDDLNNEKNSNKIWKYSVQYKVFIEYEKDINTLDAIKSN